MAVVSPNKCLSFDGSYQLGVITEERKKDVEGIKVMLNES